MTPEQRAGEAIDRKLVAAGWVVQDFRQFAPGAGCGLAVREYPTDQLVPQDPADEPASGLLDGIRRAGRPAGAARTTPSQDQGCRVTEVVTYAGLLADIRQRIRVAQQKGFCERNIMLMLQFYRAYPTLFDKARTLCNRQLHKRRKRRRCPQACNRWWPDCRGRTTSC